MTSSELKALDAALRKQFVTDVTETETGAVLCVGLDDADRLLDAYTRSCGVCGLFDYTLRLEECESLQELAEKVREHAEIVAERYPKLNEDAFGAYGYPEDDADAAAVGKWLEKRLASIADAIGGFAA